MARLTKCKLKGRRLRLLRPWLVLRLLVLFGLVSALAFMQIHLRFRTRDMNIEARKLQQKRVELANRQASLRAEVERMKRFDRDFQAYAREELGLVECPPERCKQVRIAQSTLERWEAIGKDDSTRVVPAVESGPSNVVKLARLGQQVLNWSTLSMASDGQEPVER
ncbi:MAG: FtsB family cell division protein [Candidatus Sumerlaeota bacterium]